MNDYIKFLIEEIKKEKAIEYNTGHGDKNSKEVISPISFIEKKEKTIENIDKENSFKEENVIDYSSKTIEKESIIIDSNVDIDDKSNHSLVTFDSMYEDKIENEIISKPNSINKTSSIISIENPQIEKEGNEIDFTSSGVNKTSSIISIENLQIEKEGNEIDFTSSGSDKTEIKVTPNYEEIDKIGKLVESSSLTGAVDYIADSFGKPYLSISGFSFFDWKAFEEKTMRPVYNKLNYYPEESTASRLASYAGLGADVAEADLVGIASSVWDIVSFTIGGKKKDINNRRHDLLIKPEYNEFDKGKDEEYFAETENNFEKERTETGFTFASNSVENLDELISKNQKKEDLELAKDKTVYGEDLSQLVSDNVKENNSIPEKNKTVEEKEDNFEENKTGTELSLTSDSVENLDELISKNQKKEDLELKKNTVEEKGDFKKEKAVTELTLTSDSVENLDELISKNQKEDDDDDFTKDKTVEEKENNFEENKTENDLTLISGAGEIDPDFKKEKIDSSIDISDINYDLKFDKIRNSEEYNSIGYIYVSPVNDDAVSGSKFIRIPLQSNLVNNGETLKAEYNTTDFLGRIGSVQQYIRTGSQTFSLETYYHVDANTGYNGYTMKDLQKIEMMYKSLVFPKLKEVETDGTNIGYSFYTRPPIINIEIGNLNEFKSPKRSDGTLPDLDSSDVINNFFTRVNYSGDNFKVNFKDFIVTDLEITKDYEKTPFYLEEKKYTINDNKISLYSPKDLMGFKVSLTVTEIDPNYFGILPSFDDYAKFATRA